VGATATIFAPFDGRVVDLGDLPDPVFAQGIMGGGVALDPSDAPTITALAPCAGSVAKVFPGGHGIAIESTAGPILLHLGLETVALKGVGLRPLVGDGDQILAGQPVVELAASSIRAGGTLLLTPIVAIGGQRVEHLAVVGAQVRAGDPLMAVHPT
jgi:glucose-specific phosphotransferase system IIA component